MELSGDNYSLEEDDYFQPTIYETNADSIKEIPIKANYKKWINSESEISTISNIINLEYLENLEIESSYDKNSQNIENNKKEIIEKEQKENDKIKNDKSKKGDKKEETKDKKYNYSFEWNEGGKNVKITGSFCDWKIKFDMKKDEIIYDFHLKNAEVG